MHAQSCRHKTALLGAGLAITILAEASFYAALVCLNVVAVREDVCQLLWTLDFRLWAEGEARAEEASRTFHIAAQPLANALVVFSEQSGLAVMAPADLVRDKTAPVVEGVMPPLTALDRLLKGSGLRYSHSAEGALLIIPAGSTKAIERRPAAPRAEMVPNRRIAESCLGRDSTTRQIRLNTLTKHFSAAVNPGRAASFGFPSGRAPASGVRCRHQRALFTRSQEEKGILANSARSPVLTTDRLLPEGTLRRTHRCGVANTRIERGEHEHGISME